MYSLWSEEEEEEEYLTNTSYSTPEHGAAPGSYWATIINPTHNLAADIAYDV